MPTLSQGSTHDVPVFFKFPPTMTPNIIVLFCLGTNICRFLRALFSLFLHLVLSPQLTCKTLEFIALLHSYHRCYPQQLHINMLTEVTRIQPNCPDLCSILTDHNSWKVAYLLQIFLSVLGYYKSLFYSRSLPEVRQGPNSQLHLEITERMPWSLFCDCLS